MEVPHVFSAIGIVIAIVNFLYTRFTVHANLNREVGELNRSTKTLHERSDSVDRQLQDIYKFHDDLREQLPKIDLFWDFVRQEFPKMLMHHNEYHKDLLLAKMSADTINLDEAQELMALLIVEYEHIDKKSAEAMINLITRFVLAGMINARS